MRFGQLKTILGALSFTIFAGCVGTVEDLEKVDSSQIKEPVSLDFEGVADCYAISQNKLDVRFKEGSVANGDSKNENLIYQAFLNGNYDSPVASSGLTNLRKDSENYYHLTLENLEKNTSYSVTVKVFDPQTGVRDDNFATCNLRTLAQDYPIFSGLETVAPINGIAGQTNVKLTWNTAIPAKFIVGSIPADGYSIDKYKVLWSTTSAKLEDMSLLTEIVEDPLNPITEYTVSGLNPGENYYFMVRAIDESGREEKNVKILGAQTSLPSVVAFDGIKTASVPKNKSGYTTIEASWDSAVGDFNKYRIYAIPKSNAAFSMNSVDPNSDSFLAAEITDTEKTSTVIPGLVQDEEYAIFVAACMWDDSASSCQSYAGNNIKKTAITTPPLAPFSGISSINKLPGTAGLSNIKLLWNPPSIGQGVCDKINVYLVNNDESEELMANCSSPEFDPAKPCFTSAPTCSDLNLTVGNVTIGENFCYKAKVFENGREQESTPKRCYTNNIQKPVFDSPPTCAALDGGTEIQVEWSAPAEGDYENFIFITEAVDAADTDPLNATTWMSNAISDFETGSTPSDYTFEALSKSVVSKKVKNLSPGSKYRFAVKTLINTGGTNYFDDNANVVECSTKELALDFNGWKHVLGLGPRINGIWDHTTSGSDNYVVNKYGGYTETFKHGPRGIVTEILYNENGHLIPKKKPEVVRESLWGSNFFVGLVDNSAPVQVNVVEDATLTSPPYFSFTVNGRDVEIRIRNYSHSSYNYCSHVRDAIAADSQASALIKIYCDSNSYFRYAIGASVTLEPMTGGRNGIVALVWDSFKTSNGVPLDDFLFQNQVPTSADDGYYLFRKVTSVASNENDFEALLNNIAGSSSGWEALNTLPITADDGLYYADYLPDGFHPVHGTNPGVAFRSKANTGKVVWYTVRYKLNGKFLNFATDGTNLDSIIPVLVPPANMASVHPWIANMLMCKQMGKDIDRENNYRCEFGGLGAKEDDNQYFYDVDGHVVVDRWQLGCNVSYFGDETPEGDSLGCIGDPLTDHYLNEAPLNSCHTYGGARYPGYKNSVAFAHGQNLCLINVDDGSGNPTFTNWKTVGQLSASDMPQDTEIPTSLPSEYHGRLYTSSEGYGGMMSSNDSSLPPLTNLNFMQAHYMCSSHAIQVEKDGIKSNPIRKRQLSSREYQHMAMPSIIMQNPRPDAEINQTNNSTQNPSYSQSIDSLSSMGRKGDCITKSIYYDYLMDNYWSYRRNYSRVLSDGIGYLYGNSYSKELVNTGSYFLGDRDIWAGTERCVSGFGVQDYIGQPFFLNDHALCKKDADDSNATCKIYPEQNWMDAFDSTFQFPLTKFIADDYADRSVYQNALGQSFFWRFYDDAGPNQFGLPRAENTPASFGSYTYSGQNINKRIHRSAHNFNSFSWVLGQPLNCQSGEGFCHSDDVGALAGRPAASDYGQQFVEWLSNPFDIYIPQEYNASLTDEPEYFTRVLTVEPSPQSHYNGENYSFTMDDGLGAAMQLTPERGHHRFATHWSYDHEYSSGAVGVRCGVKVKLNMAGDVIEVDGKGPNN